MPMKNKTLEPDEDGMLPEYDFSGKNVIHGKHYQLRQQGYTVRIHNEDGSITERRYPPTIALDPDVAVYFPNSESVNNALRTLIALVPAKQVSEKKASYAIRKKTAKSIAARK
jgi:hypothetical protein